MSKEDEGERPRIKNTPAQDLEANRQIQRKIDESFQKVSESSFKKYEKELTHKNTYFTNTKYPEVNEQDLALDQEETMKRFSGKLSDNMQDGYYCPKCTSKSYPCIHIKQRAQIKDKFEYPITSSSVYGWFKPYDNLGDNHNLTSATAAFYDSSHL